MAEEILDLEKLDTEIEQENKVEKRIKDLSEKVRLTSEERDAKRKELEDALNKSSNLEKEVQFLNSFGDQLSKHPEAGQFRDQIKEKVLKGYSIEDATITTLASQGKFNPPKQEAVIENIAGGSAAVNQPITGGPKKPHEMTREEKRNALLEAERRGDFYVS